MEIWTLNKLHIFPTVNALWQITGLLFCLCIAYWQGHVSIYVPYISETGGKMPESGIFTFILCIGAFLEFFCMIIRYLINYMMNSQCSKLKNMLNKIALFIGCISLCGMIAVGCYPVSSLIELHMRACYITFFGKVFYGFIQMSISLIIQPRIYRSRLFQIRLALCIFSLLFLTGMIASIVKMLQGLDTYDKVTATANKMPGDEGFELLLTSAICEWMIGISFLSFIISFAIDFRMFNINILIHENRHCEDILEISGTSNGKKEQLKGTKKEK